MTKKGKRNTDETIKSKESGIEKSANWFAVIIALLVGFAGSVAYLHNNFVTKTELIALNTAKGSKVYSCPSTMSDSCTSSSSCQSMCVGQLQLNNSGCVSRTYGGKAKSEKCELVGYLNSFLEPKQ